METVKNPHRGRGIESIDELRGRIVADPGSARDLFRRCPVAAETPLLNLPELAGSLGLGGLSIKDESNRMGLGSFKALGAVHAIARMAARRVADPASVEEMSRALAGEVFVCASAGNHGLSVAAGARIFGAGSVVFIAETVSDVFADRLRARGAEVVRSGRDYEASVSASIRAAEERGWTLLADSSWPGYHELPSRVMEGYLISGAEVIEGIPETPSHIFLQAGVGGFAAAIAALFRRVWRDDPTIVVVEPDAARCLTDSVLASRPVVSPGPVSSMGRLDCKESSHIALAGLAMDADYFVTIEDGTAERAAALLADHGVATTPSGAAGLAGVTVAGGSIGVNESSRVLVFVTEGPERPP